MTLHTDWTDTKKDSEAKLADTSASYRRAITASAAEWTGIQPDFRKPLLDALTAIDAALA